MATAPSPAEPSEEKGEEEDPAAAPAPPPKGYELVGSVLDHLGLVPRTVNGTGHTGPSEFCATSI